MLRRLLTNPRVIPVALVAQIVPLLMFPASAFTLKTQEWWLPALLTLLTVLALIQLLVRRSPESWPWHVLGFSQGFNIISRLMMLMPHAAAFVDGVQRFDVRYVALSIGSMVLSAGALWLGELPEVRASIQARAPVRKAA
jgi:hypothetical protein